MEPESYLRLAAVGVSSTLQITAAYLACLVITRVVRGPRLRFAAWRIFICTSSAYWVLNLLSLWHALQPTAAGNEASDLSRRILVPRPWAGSALFAIESLAAIYILGFVLALAALVWRHVRLRMAVCYSAKAQGELEKQWRDLCHSHHVEGCELFILPGASSPAAAFIWRPRVLLPEDFHHLSAPELQMDVLRHELAHITRRDYLWATLADLAACVLWFHPGIEHARREMRMQRELACDEAVVAERPERRADYAQCLVAFARLEMLAEAPSLGIDFASSSLLAVRVKALLHQPEPGMVAFKTLRAAVALLAVTVFIGVFPMAVIALGISPERIPQQVPSTGLAIRSKRSVASKRRRPQPSLLSPSATDRGSKTQNVAPNPEVAAAMIYPPDGAVFDSTSSTAELTPNQDAQDTNDQDPNAPVWQGPPSIQTPSPRPSVTREIVATVAGIILHSDHDHPGGERFRAAGSN